MKNFCGKCTFIELLGGIQNFHARSDVGSSFMELNFWKVLEIKIIKTFSHLVQKSTTWNNCYKSDFFTWIFREFYADSTQMEIFFFLHFKGVTIWFLFLFFSTLLKCHLNVIPIMSLKSYLLPWNALKVSFSYVH